MLQIVGKYVNETNDNLDEFYNAMGVPYIPRKMICATRPTIEINQNEEGEWTMEVKTLLRHTVIKFKLGEEYEEDMPGGKLKSTTTLDDYKLITISVGPDNVKLTRCYEFNDTGFILTMKLEKGGEYQAKRVYRRV